MLVSHTHRFIYLKTQKTAGTSTELVFQPACMPPRPMPSDWEEWHQTDEMVSSYGIVGGRLNGRRATFGPHMSAREIIAAVGRQTWDSYFRFANVRNPWDKLVSHFFWSRRAVAACDRRDAFAAFIADYSRPEVERLLLHPDFHLDAYIRYEHLTTDLMRVADACNVALPNGPLPRMKADIRPPLCRDYRQLYGDVERRRVAELFADWIEEFGYAF